MKLSKFMLKAIALSAVLAISAALAGCNNNNANASSSSASSTITSDVSSEQADVSADSNSESKASSKAKTKADLSETMGSWILAEGNGYANIVMNGMGQFAAYDDNNSLNVKGEVQYVAESGDNAAHYDLYSEDGELVDSVYFDNDSRFHVGTDASAYYELYIGSSAVSSKAATK